METVERYEKHLLGNYAPAPITLVRGEGTRVWDDTGRRYLDFCSGLATNSLGHAHPHWVAAVSAQAATLAHVSNLFRNKKQALLAQKLSTRTDSTAGLGKFFFCNSGTEANEALLKLARLHGRHKSGGIEGASRKIVVACNAFHGRTFGAMSVTPQEKIQKGFRPLLDEIVTAPLNNTEKFEALIDDDTAAVLVEPLQGEGGLATASAEFLHALRALCDKHGALLLFDEIQTGVARTGKFFAFEHAAVSPDAFSLAKGLAGGFPIGAVWIAEKHASLFAPGSHGTTFGGNPLACAAAIAVQEVIDEEHLLEKIPLRSKSWHASLNALAARYPNQVREVRGIGYLTGLALRTTASPFVSALRENNLLTAAAGDNVVRLLPPLTVSPDELDESIRILEFTLKQLQA
ncbi:MAG: aspartate aminotransferase family protein [Puniceicoccales bacterium]|jgi:acetylornithine aminotransferase/acetylornithine/N-succinyldiaminopimelate aminotransferase|nr:aspartate aminotransferase family protein [Puniceicoccales bacterium]